MSRYGDDGIWDSEAMIPRGLALGTFPSSVGVRINGAKREAEGVGMTDNSHFANCLTFGGSRTYGVPEFSVSSRGVRTNSVVHRYRRPDMGGQQNHNYGLILPLDCHDAAGARVGIFLKKCGPFEYVRDAPWELGFDKGPASEWLGDAATRYIRTQLPYPGPHTMSPTLPMIQFVARSRQHTFQYQVPSDFTEVELCSKSRWDPEDRVFGTWGNRDWDWCFLRISGEDLSQDTLPPVPLDYAVIVLGWRHCPQSVVLDYQSHKDLINDIRTRLQEKEYYHTMHVLSLLVARGVERTSSMIREITGTERCAVVNLRFSMRTDITIHPHSFWHMEIVHNFVYRDMVEPPDDELWETIEPSEQYFWVG